MAKYSINQSGVEAMQELRNTLLLSINDIFESVNRLDNMICGLEDGLGIYYSQIHDECKRVLMILKMSAEGDDGIYFLIQHKLPKMISDMERLIAAGICESDGPQKTLTRGRRR